MAATKWYYRRWFVILMLTPLFLGPFALPLLLKSPNFSRTAKIALSAAMLIGFCYSLWYLIVRVLPEIQYRLNELNATLQPW